MPARGGAEVALKIYIRSFSSIELACAVRQRSPCVRALCETGVLFQMSQLKLHVTLHTWQSSHLTLRSSHCTLRSQHFTSHCPLKTPHFILHTALFTPHTSHCTPHPTQSPCNIMQPFQCDVPPQLQETHGTTHTGTTTRCKTHRRKQSRPERPPPQPPHRRGTFHRRLQPLYTEKNTVSCSGFLPKT